MATAVEILSVAAAVVSAIGGAFAALAAMQSARSANKVREAADAMQRDFARRDLVVAAGDARVEAMRAKSRAERLKPSYRTLLALSGSVRNARQDLYEAEIDKKIDRIEQLVEDARKFGDGAASLKESTIDDILRIQMRLMNSVKEIGGLREELDREYDQIERQCAERRQSMDKTGLTR